VGGLSRSQDNVLTTAVEPTSPIYKPGHRDLIDEIWYLDVTDDERQRRLVRRHEAFGKPHDEASVWATGSDQRNADVVDTTRERADLIITLTGPPAVSGDQRPVAVGHREA